MSRLSKNAILRHRAQGNIVIEPFIERHLNTVSYDVRLGEWFYRENARPTTNIFNPWDKKSSEIIWCSQAQRAKEAHCVMTTRERSECGIKPNDLVIRLMPLETILGHTIEFIGGKNCVTGDMSARSSAGRSNLLVCKCAGYGDVGFYNRWTMEITNISPKFTLTLIVGRRIAQISFEEVEPITDSYNNQGKYQFGQSVDELIVNWRPEMMLPRMYLDYEVQE